VVVRVQVFRRPHAHRHAFGRGQHPDDAGCDLACNLLFNGQNVRVRTVELLTPHSGTARCLHELHGNAQVATRPPHAAADEVRHPQDATDRRRVVSRRTTIASHGIAGLDDQSTDLAEAGVNILREAVGEIDVGCIVREVVEVQHRHAR
jgi:hypothetical protein